MLSCPGSPLMSSRGRTPMSRPSPTPMSGSQLSTRTVDLGPAMAMRRSRSASSASL